MVRIVAIVAVMAILCGVVVTADKPNDADMDMMDSSMAISMEKQEESTESPIADMALLTDIEETKNETKSAVEGPPKEAQRHTVADFIIHPLIAFKPRPTEDEAEGKQAASDSASSTTASPWQLFGFNTGQGFGSSVSSLAGSVGNWFNDRIQLPALVDTPVRGQTPSTSSSTSTTSTTTLRPDVVVRVQHRASTRAPLISITNQNRPNQLDFEDDDDEDEDDEDNNGNAYDDDDEDEEDNDGENDDSEYDDDEEEEQNQVNANKRRRPNNNNVQEASEEYDDEKDDGEHDDDNNDDGYEDDENNVVQRPNRRRNPVNSQNGNRNRNGNRNGNRNTNWNHRVSQPNRKSNRNHNNNGNGNGNRRFESDRPRRYPTHPQQYDASDESVEDEDADDDASEEYYYDTRPSTKRSQSSSFMQRVPQSFMNQIRQLTRGQTPAEIGAAMRKPTSSGYAMKKRPQQATLLINRNGQTVYMAPELMQPLAAMPNMYYPQTPVLVRNPNNMYPQPPLTLPLKRKGRPTQYITIPWSQLGISPPSEMISLTDGIQSQPLILNIPQSAINAMQSPNRKKKRPVITPDAVPLLAEASLMDVFKPPQIPPSRTANKKPTSLNSTPVNKKKSSTTSKPTKASALLPQRIRPGTVVEMAAVMNNDQQSDEPSQYVNPDAADTKGTSTQSPSYLRAPIKREEDGEFIIVGDDNEPGLTRQVQPVFGDARYTGVLPYFELINRKHYAPHRKQGRFLSDSQTETAATEQQQIPVQIIQEGEAHLEHNEAAPTDPPKADATDLSPLV